MPTFSVSNILGIDPKPFDPSTYVEEDFFVTDATGFKRPISSNIIICWRKVTNPDRTNEKDGGTNPEKASKTESQGEAELKSEKVPNVLEHCQARRSRSPDNETDTYQAVLSAAALSDFLRNYGSDHKEKGNYADAVPAEDVICETAQTEKKYKGKAVDSPLVEIPLQRLSICPDEMATFSISNILGIDPKPFDPSTYVEEDFFVTDATGFKRHISFNIICCRKVTNPDRTVQSNARFVTWLDGSLQFFIGNEGFDVSEQDVKEIQSHIFSSIQRGFTSLREGFQER